MKKDYTYVPKHYAPRTAEKMQEVLMTPDAPSPNYHYYMIRGGSDQTNITVWEPGTVGGEYIKTYGHYHIGNLDETYQILQGEGVALLQKLALNDRGQPLPDTVEEFKAIKVKAGDSIYMAPGHGHLLVNTGETFLVTSDNSPVNFEEKDPTSLPGHANYELVKQMRGFAYYVIEKDGKPALKKNLLYKEIIKEDFGGLEVVA